MIEYTVKVDKNGTKFWYVNDKLHREDGPAVEWTNGNKWWCINGVLHRVDGPAIVHANGDKRWYVNGKLHRDDGPAVEDADGDKEWHIDGVPYTEAEFNMRMNPTKELTIAEIEKLLGYSIKVVK